MGGGGGSFDGYVLPTRLLETGNGDFGAVGAGSVLTVTGNSTPYDGSSWTLTYDVTAETDAERYVWVPAGLFE
jgi:hypothetical protein